MIAINQPVTNKDVFVQMTLLAPILLYSLCDTSTKKFPTYYSGLPIQVLAMQSGNNHTRQTSVVPYTTNICRRKCSLRPPLSLPYGPLASPTCLPQGS
jgi:hypothetical protein